MKGIIMFERSNIEFNSDGTMLRGWFYRPKEASIPYPCIIMAHGFTALKEHYLDKFAAVFADNGMCVLVYDNRNFGDSDGEPRLEVNPFDQVRDYRNAITFAQSLPGADKDRIGIWGASFSGGHVITVAARDKRVKCAVSLVPFISGYNKSIRLNKPDRWSLIREMHNRDRANRLNGNPPQTLPVVSLDESENSVMKLKSAHTFFTSVEKWPNAVTLRSVEMSGDYEPIAYIKQISPTPLLFIVARSDTINTTDIALKAYSKAREPKKLVFIPGDHFSPYVEEFETCSKSACDWFLEHLQSNDLALDRKIRSRL